MPVRAKRDRLAIDQGAVCSQTADRLRDLRQSVGEIRTVAAPKGHSASLLASDDPVAVVLAKRDRLAIDQGDRRPRIGGVMGGAIFREVVGEAGDGGGKWLGNLPAKCSRCQIECHSEL